MLESRGASALLALVILICTQGSGAAEPTTATDSSDTTQQLEEVVVNARKRDERVLDIPESIAVISESELTGRGIESIEDVGRQTPNLQMNMRQDLTTNVAIRGVGAYGDVLGVGFSIDDVPNFTDQTDDLGFAKFTSISSYTNSNSAFNIDASQTPPGQPGENSYTLPHNRPTEVTTQELRLTSPSGGHFEWLVGLYGAIIKNVILNQIGASYLPTPDVPTELYDFDTRRTDTAAFGTLAYHLGPVRLDAGARATRTLYEAQLWVDAPGPPDQYGTIISRGVLPKFSLSYTLPDGAQIYATAAKGEEPGAINTNSGAPVPYLAETAWSYELGAKGELLDRRLEYELAGFYVSNHNQQFQSNLAVPNLGLLAVTTNIGDSRSSGAETSINWRLSDRWRLGLSGGYLDALWLHASYFGQPIDGLQVQNSPHVTTSTNIGYSQPVFNGLRFDANFDMSYTDAMWWDPPNTPGTKEHPHFLGDARVALGTDGRGWQVALRGTNLLGAKYWTEYVPGVYPPGVAPPCAGCTDLGTPGARRQFFGSVTYKY
jgi:outer membrane receptor protein involved in Fe transport